MKKYLGYGFMLLGTAVIIGGAIALGWLTIPSAIVIGTTLMIVEGIAMAININEDNQEIARINQEAQEIEMQNLQSANEVEELKQSKNNLELKLNVTLDALMGEIQLSDAFAEITTATHLHKQLVQEPNVISESSINDKQLPEKGKKEKAPAKSVDQSKIQALDTLDQEEENNNSCKRKRF